MRQLSPRSMAPALGAERGGQAHCPLPARPAGSLPIRALRRPLGHGRGHSALRRGFTLIEIMIVVGIMGIVMTMSVPLVYKLWHKAPMIKAVRDVSEVLSRARAQAIMQGSMAEVVFRPRERILAVSAAASPRPPHPENADLGAPAASPPPPPGSGRSATLDESIAIEMLDVNLTEFKDAETARVRFYPDGTCDELTLILHSLRSDKNEWYKITLEITTSLAAVGPVDR